MENSFYNSEELKKIPFKSIGENVLISRKVSIYGPEKISIGNNVRIDDFCVLSGEILIGNYIHIATSSLLFGGIAGITISDYSNISSRVAIYSVSDDYSGQYMTNPMIPEEFKKTENKPVLLEKHVIIGTGSTILPGVILQEGTSVGAMSLINKTTDCWSIYIGIPARKIKKRSRGLLDYEEKMKNQE